MVSKLAMRLAVEHGEPDKNSYLGKVFRRDGVPDSPELRRVLALPRRDWRATAEEWYYQMQAFFALPGGTMSLLPWQAAALAEAYTEHGLLGSMGVGSGKTLFFLLAPLLLELERPILIVPASTRHDVLNQHIPEYRKHFRLHPRLQVFSAARLSTEEGYDLLMRYRPDGIIIDECHMFKHPDSARTMRLMRYFAAYPETLLVAGTGTLCRRSTKEYRHLERLARPENSVFPRDNAEADDWADAIDFEPASPLAPGALEMLQEQGESLRRAWGRRLAETPGIIFTTSSSCSAELRIRGVETEPPETIASALEKLQTTWCTPGGEECESGLDLHRHAKELSCGFYYRWVWPVGKDGKPEVNRRWLEARKAWRKYVREKIVYGRVFDSPLLVEKAVIRGDLYSPQYQDWLDVRDEYDPVTEPVWTDLFLADVVRGCLDHEGSTLIWVEHDAVGRMLSEQLDLPYFAAGVTGETICSRAGQHVILSAHAHKTGKNLQAWSRNLVVSPPSSGADWEQLLGRTHRQGQKAHEVLCDVLLHTSAMQEAFATARAGARFAEEVMLQQQKLNLAAIEGVGEGEADDGLARELRASLDEKEEE